MKSFNQKQYLYDTKMKNMKKYINYFVILLTGCILLTACNKDYEKIKIQNHGENDLMALMHDMMDEMNAATMTGDPDYDFAMMMVMHHQGAIEMADYEIANGDDGELKSMAEEMEAAQQAETAVLDSFMAATTPDMMDDKFMDEVMMSMDKMDKNADLQVIIGETDYDFASLIIVHHQSAMEMAYAILEHGEDEMIMEMAHEMIDMQLMEIEELQNWLLENKDY